MNVGKSIKVAMAMKDMNQQDLAGRMKVSKPYISQIVGKEHAGVGTIVLLADAFGMKVSEFLALGED